MFSFSRQLPTPARAKRFVFAAFVLLGAFTPLVPTARAASSPLSVPINGWDDVIPAEQTKPGKWTG